jgi:glycosyltransferase involved in cell wall biosynthesis
VKTIRVLAMLEARAMSGSAKAVLEFATEAAMRHSDAPKIDLSILTFDRGEGETPITKAIRDIGIPLDIVRERRRFDTDAIQQLRAAAENRRADIIWSNSVKSHFLVRWSGLHRSRRWVAFHHGYTSTDVRMKIYNQLDRWSLRGADQVLTSSAAFVEELVVRQVSRDAIHVQHMPVRPWKTVSEGRKEELRRELGLKGDARVVLSIGRLSREKGHVYLVRAFPKLQELAGDSQLHLVLVGEGPERQKIQELCRSLNITKSVTLAGQKEDVSVYYGIAAAFVLPSLSEGCPNVLLESLAAGVPVVATEVGGVPEVVTNGQDAILVKSGDREGLALATAQVLKDQELRKRLVACGRDIVLKKSPEAYFRSIAAVFDLCCADEVRGR